MLLALTQDRPKRQTSLVRSAAVAFFASITLAATSTSAFAGAAEYAALNEKLGGSKTVDVVATASASQLAAAISFFYTPANNPKKLNPAIIAGEALKRSLLPNAGTVVAGTFPGSGNITYGTKVLQKNDFASFAIKTTATGAGLTVVAVPSFTAALVATDDEAKAIALLVKASKVAVGAVFQGRASELGSDALKQALANAVLTDKNYSAAVVEIATGVATQVADPVAYTRALVNNTLNAKNIVKIIPGIVAGKPTSAGVITAEALTNATYSTAGASSPIIKAAAALALSIGKVADIEQIQKVGQAIAAEIPKTTTVKGKAVPNIKLAASTTIVKTLAAAIAAKPFAATGANRTDNKADELGELAAYFIKSLSTSAEFTATKVVKGVTVAVTADKIVATILKNVVAGGKAIKVGAKGLPPTKADVDAYVTKLAAYVAGSVALTIKNLPAVTADQIAWKLSITNALTATAFAKSVAGALNETAVKTAISTALNGTSGPTQYEDGNIVIGAITDPETNTRTF
jgi:hypothetical protein